MFKIVFVLAFFAFCGAVMSQSRRNLRPFGHHGNYHEGQEISNENRKWAVKIKPEYYKQYSEQYSLEEMAKSIASEYGLKGNKIGNLREWVVFSEDQGTISDEKVEELTTDKRFLEIKLEIPHRVVPKLRSIKN